MSAPKIVLYTSHGCPWAQRAHIALSELGLAYETVIVDLSVPRTPEYLAINPRGLVPALVYNGEVFTESAIVSQFLVDSHPSHLENTSSEPGGPLQRAKINFFVDTYFNKVHPFSLPAFKAKKGEEKEAAAENIANAIVKEIEPLLADAAPFFGGSDRFTLAEVQTASFVIRLLSLAEYEDLLPASILTTLESKAPNFWKWANVVVKQESVTQSYDLKKTAESYIKRLAPK